MAQIAKVDDRGRIKLSREIAEPGSSVVIIDADSYFLGIPIPSDPLQASGGWIKTKDETRKLKAMAEEKASDDAVSRARRRKQI